MTQDPLIQRLCQSAGIALAYDDGFGRERRPGDEDLTRLLQAMEIAASEGAERDLEARQWRSLLPPVVVCRAPSQRARIPLTVTAAKSRQALSWRIEPEEGTALTGQVIPSELSLIGTRTVDGVPMERRAFEGIPDLPLGHHRFHLQGQGGPMPLIVGPERCHLPVALEDGERRYWGITLQLYALCSARNWGIGDLTDLRQLGRLAAGAGADFLGINPLHAHPLLAAEDVSPYAASSRLFVDPIYIDVALAAELLNCCEARAVMGTAVFQAGLEDLRQRRMVDYEAVAETKRRLLLSIYGHFCGHHLEGDGAPARRYRQFLADQGEELTRFAAYEADREGALLAARGAPSDTADAGFHGFVQWLAAEQLAGVQQDLKAAGMAIGLYRDLAVGPAERGAESAAWDGVFAKAASAGAPADNFSLRGQCWNLRVFDPAALRAAGYAPFIALLRHNMAFAGALRIDHVMALQRLFWIPEGRDGTAGSYVTYPLDDLLTLVALESRRADCLVIGEDLGTVPPDFRDAMARAGLLRFHVLLYERDEEGAFRPPARYSRLSIATPATHDTPTLKGFWLQRDIDAREALGFYDGPEEAAAARSDRSRTKQQLFGLLETLGLAPAGAAPDEAAWLAKSAHRALGQAPCALMALQLDDLLGEADAVNLPGSDATAGNWRRKYGKSIKDIEQAPELIAPGF